MKKGPWCLGHEPVSSRQLAHIVKYLAYQRKPGASPMIDQVLLALPSALIDEVPQNFRRRFDARHCIDRFAGKETHRADRSRRGPVDPKGKVTRHRHPFAVERGRLANRIALEGV